MSGGASSGNMDDIYFGALFEARILDELRPSMTSRDFVRWGPKGKSTIFSFSLMGDPGPSTGAFTEGTDYTTVTDLTTSKNSVTAAEVGLATTVSDILVEVSIMDVLPYVKSVLNRSTLEKWEGDLGAIADNFGTATTAASTLTPDDFLAAVSAIEQRDAATGPLVAYLHPKQTGELRREVASTTAIVTAGEATGGVPTSAVTGGTNSRGDWGTLFGVRVYQTSIVASSSSLRQGSIFVSGQCIGGYELWAPRVETQRFATLRGVKVVSTACYGVGNVEVTNRGQMLKSAA